MHQLQQQVVPTSPLLPQQQPLQQQQQQPQPQQQQIQQQQPPPQPEVPIVNGNSTNPLLNGCTTLVTNTNINVTYLNGAINGNKQYEADKFKMHQGFIAVLKVREG